MAATSAPLADYFWIAGIDSLSYSGDNIFGPIAKPTNGVAGPPSPAVDATIEEGSEGDVPTMPPRANAKHSRSNSYDRLSKLSNKASRNSTQTLDELEPTSSNRSSVTIKAGTTNGGGPTIGSLSDYDFDQALQKFAGERDEFMDELSFSAGVPDKVKPTVTTPRIERIRIEDGDLLGVTAKRNPLRSVGGSIRRRISFRDLNSMKRQPSMVQRASE